MFANSLRKAKETMNLPRFRGTSLPVCHQTLWSRLSLKGNHYVANHFRFPIQTQRRPLAHRTRINSDYFRQLLKSSEQRVRTVDYDGWLCGLLLPKDSISRLAYFSVRLFNIEVAQVKDVSIRNPMTGTLRLEWWKQTIHQVYKKEPPEQPIAKALTFSLQELNLTKTWFLKIIDRRLSDLNNPPMRKVEDLERYSEETASSLLYLCLECLGVKNIQADHAASHLGKAIGLCTLLKGTPYNASQGWSYLPLDLMAKHNVTEEDLFRGVASAGLSEITFEIASVAKIHLDKARLLQKEVPKDALPVFYLAVSVEDFLNQLQAANFNLFDPKITRRSIWYYINILKCKFTQKF